MDTVFKRGPRTQDHLLRQKGQEPGKTGRGLWRDGQGVLAGGSRATWAGLAGWIDGPAGRGRLIQYILYTIVPMSKFAAD